ncbi:MAG: PAS domain S-box protein [Candidatus Lindowbacteria bacterium]|nr:PAS domain S-box protein [Candidatus Lindowbacteria bacterium]
MSYSEFNRKLEELRVRMARVQRLVAASADPSNQVLSEFFKSLQTTLGEAQILEDKLFAAREEQSLAAREITPSERRRYEEMFDFSPDGCVVTDPSGVILQANHTAADLLNVPHDSLPGNSLILFLPESEHKAYYSRLAQLNESGRVKKWEAQLQPLQGAPFYAAINALSMRNWQGAMTDMVWLIHDITDHKRMEEVLRKERDKAQEYLNIVQTVIVAIDADRKVALINRKGCEVLGYKEEEIVGKNWFDNFLPERIRKDVEAGFQRLMAGKMEEGEYYENPVLTARGERILSWHNAVLCDEAGGIVGTLSSGEDITERKLAEAALRKSEERYRTLVEEAKDMIITVDLKTGIIASANSFAEQILGYSRKEVVGRTHFLSFIHPDEHERAMANLRERVAGDIRTPNFPLRIVKADGECLEAELNGAVIFDDKGNPEIFMCVIRDVTERRHIEQSLRESEQRYRLLVENSLAGIYIRQGDKITFANKRFLDLLGYTQEDLRRMSFIDFVHPEDRETATQRASHRMAGRFQEGPFQYRILKKNGDIVWVEVFGTLFIYGGQRAILGNLIDITERKKFEVHLYQPAGGRDHGI